jgi:hypothetical protein
MFKTLSQSAVGMDHIPVGIYRKWNINGTTIYVSDFAVSVKPIQPTSTSLLGSAAHFYKKSANPSTRGRSVVRFTLWLLLLPRKEFPGHSA